MFVFNGGPGASSAFLHVGAVGPRAGRLPRRRDAAGDAAAARPERRRPGSPSPTSSSSTRSARASAASIEHGGRRTGERQKDGGKKRGATTRPSTSGRSATSSRCASSWAAGSRSNGRWGSPVFIAGESYGGYRVGRLVRMLQETRGIGLNGAILISPALEIASLDAERLRRRSAGSTCCRRWPPPPSTTAARAPSQRGAPLEEVLREAETFATGDYASFLARGASLAGRGARAHPRAARRPRRPAARARDAAPRGGSRRDCSPASCSATSGRCSASTTRRSRSPTRSPTASPSRGPDPTLSGLSPAFTMGVNRQLRSEIGVETDREYTAPQLRGEQRVEGGRHEQHFFAPPPGATDDFRYGMSLNPHLKAFITHGRYDLVTPYYASDRLRNLMRLDPATRRPPHRPPLRRRPHVLRLGGEPPRVHGGDPRLRRRRRLAREAGASLTPSGAARARGATRARSARRACLRFLVRGCVVVARPVVRPSGAGAAARRGGASAEAALRARFRSARDRPLTTKACRPTRQERLSARSAPATALVGARSTATPSETRCVSRGSSDASGPRRVRPRSRARAARPRARTAVARA